MTNNTIKTAEAWECLFERYKILSHIEANGTFHITSKQINEVREARLMAKFDQSALLPKIFGTNKLSILPITRGDYLIGPFKTHKKIEYRNVKPKRAELPSFLKTIDAKNLYSEAAALSFAYNSGIIKDIIGNENLEVRYTVNGRMKSGCFSFSIENSKRSLSPVSVHVENSQIEIDAGFESPEAFVICEAKNHVPEELLIRQLFYPYRLWKSKIQKPVIPVFLSFSNDVFRVLIYEFADDKNYNSIILKDYREYMFADEDILLQDIIELWRSIIVIPEPTAPFPQANSFPRILDLLSALYEEELTRTQITMKYEFTPRQTNYHISACEYLGLIERLSNNENKRKYRLTTEAQNIMSLPYKNKYLALIKKILERPVFYRVFAPVADGHRLPNTSEICRIMRATPFAKSIGDKTIGRRSSTVLSWLEWMIRISVTD